MMRDELGKYRCYLLTNVSQGSERINRLKAGWKGNERSGFCLMISD